MNAYKAIASVVGTVVIAGWVAYAVSAPRNADAVLNQEMEALGGQTINEHMATVQAEAAREQCETFTRLAEDGWNRAMDQGTVDRDADRLDELDAQVARYCNG